PAKACDGHGGSGTVQHLDPPPDRSIIQVMGKVQNPHRRRASHGRNTHDVSPSAGASTCAKTSKT
ncbi:MAG: hypothetical protein MUF73_16060, partial [Rhodobacteraceae bacterium]|nr:hypothetical protein [Paracoccaceae bacterium]